MLAVIVPILILSFILRCIAAALRPEGDPVPVPVYVVKKEKRS